MVKYFTILLISFYEQGVEVTEHRWENNAGIELTILVEYLIGIPSYIR